MRVSDTCSTTLSSRLNDVHLFFYLFCKQIGIMKHGYRTYIGDTNHEFVKGSLTSGLSEFFVIIYVKSTIKREPDIFIFHPKNACRITIALFIFRWYTIFIIYPFINSDTVK